VRAVFFVDPESTVRAILYYPEELGRNFDENLEIAATTPQSFVLYPGPLADASENQYNEIVTLTLMKQFQKTTHPHNWGGRPPDFGII
jgi:hypothetical protein